MICIIRGKETKATFKGVPVSKEVQDFAKWYRDKLNIQQKQKITGALKDGLKVISNNNFVDTRGCIRMFEQMKSKGFSWEKIQETLTDELLLKGLLTDEEYNSKTIS